MYKRNYNQSSMNHFQDFIAANQEQLFYLIYPLIEDRIDEILDQKLKEKSITYINAGNTVEDIINLLNGR